MVEGDFMTHEPLVSLEEAAKLLGYKASGLRKIVSRTRQGGQGATIKFFQVGQGPIKFRRKWLEEFIQANTVEPKPILRSPAQKRKAKSEGKYRLAFDPALYWFNQPWAKGKASLEECRDEAKPR
jgi:hypothetical protein